MALGYVTTLRAARVNQIKTAIGASGLLRIYSGTKPAVGGAPTTLLAELALSAVCAPDSTDGVLTFNPISPDANANASGTPTWGRLCTSAGVAVVDFTAGLSGADMNFDAAIVATGNVSVSSLVITDGSS